MSAAEALKAARAAGVELRLDGDDLVLEAAAPPPPRSSTCCRATSPASWRCCGRVGTVGRARTGRSSSTNEPASPSSTAGCRAPEAEARAFDCCVVEWLNRNFVRSPPERCLACGGGDHAHDALLPHGTEPTGHAWLHSRCWPAWYAGRKAEAVAALEAMGIATPAGFPNDFDKNGGA